MAKNLSFDEKLARMNEIVRELEQADLPLESSLKLYEEGNKLAVECEKFLGKAIQKVQVLQNNELTDFIE